MCWGGGGGKTSNPTLVEHVLEAELVVMTVWISEVRREDEPERNVSIYVALTGSLKPFIVDSQDVFVCCSYSRTQRVNGSDSQDVFVCCSYVRIQRVNGSVTGYLNEIKLEVPHTFVVVHSASNISGSYDVSFANKGSVNPKCMHCVKTDLSKRANLSGRCSPRVDQEICSDRASMLDGFQILNKRTVLVSGCNQIRGGLLRHSRLYGIALVIITTCLVCNHFKCQLIHFRL